MASGSDIVKQGQSWVTEKVPYVWGGVTKFGADCSGYVQSVLSSVGITVGRTTTEQVKAGSPVSDLSQAQPGDLLFFGSSSSSPTHVGIYVGNGQMIDEPHSGTTARQENVWSNLVAIRRVSNNSTPTASNSSDPTLLSLGHLGDIKIPTSGLVRFSVIFAGLVLLIIGAHALSSDAQSPIGVIGDGAVGAGRNAKNTAGKVGVIAAVTPK